MTPEEAKQTLFDAAKIRFPKLEQKGLNVGKVNQLEDFSMQAARWRSFLEEARLYIEEATHILVVKWEKLDGWEVNLPGGKKRKDATKDDIVVAKRLIDPDLWEGISDGKHLLRQLSTGIRRLEKDEERASRVYTFITGN